VNEGSPPVFWYNLSKSGAPSPNEIRHLAGDIQIIKSPDMVQSESGGLVWIYLNSGDQNALIPVLQNWSKISTLATVVVVMREPTTSAITKLIGSPGVFRVVEAPKDYASLTVVYRDAVAHHAKDLRRRDLLHTVREQNRELEALTKSLEGRVAERTQSLVESKSKLEIRLSQLRELLLFMKELGHVQDLEELLSLIRKDFKKFHRLGDPCLAYAQPSGGLRLMYFRGSQVFQRQVISPWSASPRIRHGGGEDAQYLANELGRPMAMTLAIPLARRPSMTEGLGPTLFFEHNLQAAEVDEILARLGERIQSVSFALDRLLLEHDLRSAVYMWEQTFDGIEDPVAVIDDKFQVLRGNAQFVRSALAPACHGQFAESDRPCSGCPLVEKPMTGDSRESMVRLQGRTYHVYSYPLIEDDGRPSHTFVHYYLDLSRQMSLQEQMIQTEKMAALGHLAGHIAHELNNPLTGIRSLCQVLRADQAVPESVKKDLGEVESAAQRSQSIISNLLQFAEGGGEHVEALDLNAAVKKTLPLLKTAMANLSSDVMLFPTPALVRADSQLIQQVIFNLIKNACQAMPTGGQLEVSVESVDKKSERWFRLRIKDTGVGLSEDVRSNLFTPFFTTKKQGEGTGLGLSMSRTVVERFGGRIEVNSKQGEGTCFDILLPAMEAK